MIIMDGDTKHALVVRSSFQDRRRMMPGTWAVVPAQRTHNNVVVVCCPECHRTVNIHSFARPFSSPYKIDKVGRVSPALLCSNCCWKVVVTLQGWVREDYA